MAYQTELHFAPVNQPSEFILAPRYSVALQVHEDAPGPHEFIASSRDACRVASAILFNSPNEKFIAISLDTKGRVIGSHVVTEGTIDASLVHPRETFRTPILLNAASIILAHNHPSGDATPSPADHAVTRRLERAGETLGIDVLDHIVVGSISGNSKSIKAGR